MMGSLERQNVLLRLQDSLMVAGQSAVGTTAALPFQVGNQTYALAFSEVQRVQLLVGMVALARYPQVPDCVIGVAGSETEMLSVIDAGLLLGHGRVQGSMKSRLVVLGDGAMKGFGLMVSRVLELVNLEEAKTRSGYTFVNAESLKQSLSSRVQSLPEQQQ